MNKSGSLLYKCRQCGEVYRGSPVPEVFYALDLLVIGEPLPVAWGDLGEEVEKLAVHVCRGHDGKYGISDLIGGQRDES